MLLVLLNAPNSAQSFITVNNTHFEKNGEPYYFLGTNFWYGMNLSSKGPGGDRERLIRELDQLKSLEINNLRIMAASEGPDSEPWRMLPSLQTAPGIYNEDLLDGLDFLLAEMAKREMYAVMCLNNFWVWSGGMAQYVQWFTDKPIPYPTPDNEQWTKYSLYTSKFYSNRKAKAAFENHLRFIVNRTNAYTGKLYKNDPTIMAWQLANEPRGMFKAGKYRRWIRKSAALIKSLDSNHLVTIGSEGNTPWPVGNNTYKDHKNPLIDYVTMHIWIQNWRWYDPSKPEQSYPKGLEKAKAYFEKHIQIAEKLGKPIVLEEFGISRDLNNHDPESSIQWRDTYYSEIFQMIYDNAKSGSPIGGANFWAWGGEGRPQAPKAIWKAGDNFIGDPPHELQGWYSVYDEDETTLDIIREFATLMNEIERK